MTCSCCGKTKPAHRFKQRDCAGGRPVCMRCALHARRARSADARAARRKRRAAAYDYRERNETLRSMGFASYADYRASNLWRAIRKRAISKHRGRCYLCGRDATDVHHARYARVDLDGSSIRKLYALCRDCHEAVEFDANTGQKLRGHAAMRRFWQARNIGKQRWLDLIASGCVAVPRPGGGMATTP